MNKEEEFKEKDRLKRIYEEKLIEAKANGDMNSVQLYNGLLSALLVGDK